MEAVLLALGAPSRKFAPDVAAFRFVILSLVSIDVSGLSVFPKGRLLRVRRAPRVHGGQAVREFLSVLRIELPASRAFPLKLVGVEDR